jgi:hypothetical protein
LEFENACESGSGCNVSSAEGTAHLIEPIGIVDGQVRGPLGLIFEKLHIHLGNILPFVDILGAFTTVHLSL